MTSFEPNILPPISEKLIEDSLPSITEEVIETSIIKRLQKHKSLKTTMKCTSLKPVRRRVTVGRFTSDSKIDKKIQRHVKRTEDNLPVVLDSLYDEGINMNRNNPRKCVADRMTLRENLTKMDDLEHWLQNKPRTSGIESKYLKNCIKEHLKSCIWGAHTDCSCRTGYNYFLKHSKKPDKFLADEAIGLHILDEYMLKNNADLFLFLKALDKNDTGVLSWSRVADALAKEKVPLETYQLLQSMVVLGCFNGGDMIIADFCEKMSNFRKYKWYRLMVNNKDRSKDLLESLKQDHPVLKAEDLVDFSIEKKYVIYRKPLDPEIFEKSHLTASRFDNEYDKIVENRFWPGAFLDKLRICYMPEDGHDRGDRHRPLFEIIRKEKEAGRPPRRLPPFSRYSIYGKNKEI